MKYRDIFLTSLTLFVLTLPALAEDFYKIESISFHKAPAKNKLLLTEPVRVYDAAGKLLPTRDRAPIPTLSVNVKTAERVESATAFARVHYYGKDKQLVETVEASRRPGDGEMPVFFEKQKRTELLFPVPRTLSALSEKDWSAVVVFGDTQTAVSQGWPAFRLPVGTVYPEKDLVEKKSIVVRKAAIDPVVEQVVKTGNPKYDQITLFMRPPKGITEGKDVRGVMAMCFIADNADQVRQNLQGRTAVGRSLGYATEFADKNQLAIIAWGSRRLWDPTKSWDELDKTTNKEMDESFDEISKAWSKGVEEFVRKYGIPKRNYLLWGVSGAAQFSCRLALRKPDYFLAVHVHIPSSFDQPTLEANRILWCLTTGELEAGYQRSLRFYAKCRELGYPMIYKAIPQLGHSGSSIADALGMEFFQYALSLRSEREAYEARLNDPLKRVTPAKEPAQGQPWPAQFRNPLFVGDIINQEAFPFSQVERVPAGYRVSLPTKELADKWNKQ